jgi:hypothetical protein
MIAILASLSVAAAGAGSPPPAGACRTVHGRMSLANGTPSVRILAIGTHRVLGVIQQDETFNDLPDNIRRLWNAKGDEAMWQADLIGDFVVCPFTTEHTGWMQMVRVKSARHLRFRPRG